MSQKVQQEIKRALSSSIQGSLDKTVVVGRKMNCTKVVTSPLVQRSPSLLGPGSKYKADEFFRLKLEILQERHIQDAQTQDQEEMSHTTRGPKETLLIATSDHKRRDNLSSGKGKVKSEDAESEFSKVSVYETILKTIQDQSAKNENAQTQALLKSCSQASKPKFKPVSHHRKLTTTLVPDARNLGEVATDLATPKQALALKP